MEVRIAAGGGQLEIMMEEDEVEEKDWPLLLNFIKKGEGCSGGFVGAQQQEHQHLYH